MAWREFKSHERRTFEREWHNRQILQESRINRDNIMIARAGLFHEGRKTYSLFYDLADGGDLDDYFGSLETKITRYGKSPKHKDIHGEPAVKRYFGQILGLASALSALHNDLEWDNKYIMLFHGDLRPANILVQNEGTDHEIWKLHDFGLSKDKEDPGRYNKPFIFHQLFGATTKSESPSSTNWRPEGTYVAPEGQSDRTLTAASDVWSLGCIISLAVCFLHEGPDSIVDYRKARKDLGGDDCFFIKKGKDLKINPGVLWWFNEREKEHKHAPSSTSHLRHRIRREILPLLRNLLSIKSGSRYSSKKIVEELKKIQARLNSDVARLDPTKGVKRLAQKFQDKLTASGSVRDPPAIWPLSIPEGSNQCKFSPHGDFLAFLSPSGISLYDTALIQHTETGKIAQPCEDTICPPESPESAKWCAFDLSSKHLVAFTNKDPSHVSPHTLDFIQVLTMYSVSYIHSHARNTP
jgi:serine/threonine protein kinase